MSVVYFHGTKREARAVAGRLVRVLTGQEADTRGLAKGVFLSLGFAALSDIKSDFIRKARGGTGEDGVKWPPLSPKYLAYHRRFGRGEKAALKKAAGLGRGNRYRGLLSKQQDDEWKAIFLQALNRFLVSMDEKAAKARAAQIAWATMKRRGAKTMLMVYGSRVVDILRDTGVLLNSLSPGKLIQTDASVEYSKPGGDGGEQQVFEAIRNGIIVGTNVPYASVHQHGNQARKIPARPFLPTAGVPEPWLARWSEVADQAVAIAARKMFEGGA